MGKTKPKLLIVTKNLPPQIGGIERLTYKTIEALSKNFICTVIGPNESKKFVTKYASFVGCDSKNLFVFYISCTIKSFISSYRNKYDIAYAASGLMAPITKIACFLSKTKRLTYIHGLDIAAENYIYQKLFVPSILSSDVILTNSHSTSKLIKDKGYKNNIVVVNPGVVIPELKECLNDNFKKNYSLEDSLILLTVGRLVHRKGVAEFILNSLPAIVEKFPSVVYVVIGREASNAVKKEYSVRDKILESIKKSSMGKHVLMIDEVCESELESAYMCSNAFIFPLIELPNDIEGFGMVAAEAGASGLPTIAFNVGGVGDAIVEGKTGSLIKSQDYQSMVNSINLVLKKDNSYSDRKECQKFAMKYSWSRFGAELSNAFSNNLID